MELVPLGPGFGVEVRGVSILDVATDGDAYKAVRAAAVLAATKARRGVLGERAAICDAFGARIVL